MANKYRSALTSTVRLNASVRPFGERDGQLSPIAGEGGDVSLRFSPVSIASRNNPAGSLGESRSLITSELPSGDQVRWVQKKKAVRNTSARNTSAILRSGPPRAGINSTAAFSRERSRRNAM